MASGLQQGNDFPIGVRFELRGVERLLRRQSSSLAKAPAAVSAAHTRLAFELQTRQKAALDRGVAKRGRQQVRGNRLSNAIIDEQNRKVRLSGWTVGHLDESWSGQVARYYRAQDIGSAVHVGKRYFGGFQNSAGGKIVAPISGGPSAQTSGRLVNLGQFGPRQRNGSFSSRDRGNRSASPQVGFRINRPIPGYRYTRKGFTSWKSAGFLGARGLAIYEQEFRSRGMRFAIRAANAGTSTTAASFGGSSRGPGERNF